MSLEDIKNSKILIVDDMPNNIELATEVLEEEGFLFQLARDGFEALKICEEEPPDLILLDIAMPGIDGFETCKRLKNNEKTRDIPIIFLSARHELDDIIRGFETGAVDYIPKPFNALELLSRVKTHLELKLNREKLLTVNKILERKVRERTSELQKANKKLSMLDKAKSEFLSLISHELRTPLNGIMGYASLVEKTAHEKQQKEFIQSLNQLIDSLARISELSLLFTELRMANYATKYKPQLVEDLVSKTVGRFLATVKEKEINVVNKTIEHNHYLIVDEFLLKNCMDILFENAIKYSPPGGEVTIDSKKTPSHIYIEIADEGPGFSERALKEAFELFKNDSLDNAYSGFGIGLATARLIMDFLSGKLEIRNRINHSGAIVTIKIPTNIPGEKKTESQRMYQQQRV